MKKLIIVVLGICLIISCKNSSVDKADSESGLIGKKELKLEHDIMTPEVLWSFGRVSEVEVSPDGTKILYGVSYYSVAENKGNRELYVMNIDGTDNKQITKTAKSEYGAAWKPDGSKITYMCGCSGSMQLWEMDVDGKNPKQLSEVQGGISGYKISPDMKKIVYASEVPLVKKVTDYYPDLDKANARIMNDIMYRHWDTWQDSYSHLFIADFNGEKLSNDLDIMKEEEFNAPNKPFSGMEQVSFSPDSKTLVYSCVKKKGKEYAISTNSDLYQYNLETKETKNLTEGMMGYDNSAVFSPDGKLLAWESMERDGYEADKIRLFVLDFEKNTKTDYSKDFDQNSNSLSWSEDGKSIFFISDWHATDEIYRLDLADGKINKLTSGVHNYLSVVQAGNVLIATHQSMSKPTEIYSVNPVDGKDTELSNINKDLLSQLAFGAVEERWVKTTDNKDMLVWVIYPPHFDKSKKYPALLFCVGGPQSTVSQFWSYRWNFQMMAANDYIIIAPNRRGLPGFGMEWLEQISGDYGGQNMKDYLSASDALAKEPFIDKDKMGCVGASYGGYSVYWLAGNHNKRFKTFIAHDGIFNLEANYLETEEMWFVNWDLGGPFWDKNNKMAQKSFTFSPHKFVDKWDTPIMVVHGGMDFRISYTQGMQAFNAAILKGIPARFLYFPEENHWVLSPQNGILWQREYFAWLDKYLK